MFWQVEYIGNPPIGTRFEIIGEVEGLQVHSLTCGSEQLFAQASVSGGGGRRLPVGGALVRTHALSICFGLDFYFLV